MNCHASHRCAQANPFATRYVRPGALTYLFEGDDSLAYLLERLAAHGGWGQIIGPHGSGKSTLLSAILTAWQQESTEFLHIALHEGEQFDWSPLRRANWSTTKQVVVDGYEQLGRVTRWRLRRYCRRQGVGLLVTAHGDVGFPTLYQSHVDGAVARQLIEHLLHQASAELEEEAIVACLARHRHDLREAFFELYDLYESQGVSRLERPGQPA